MFKTTLPFDIVIGVLCAICLFFLIVGCQSVEDRSPLGCAGNDQMMSCGTSDPWSKPL